MSNTVENFEISLPRVRLSFPDLFIPTAFQSGQPEQYGAAFLIEKGSANDKLVQETIQRCAQAKWGANAQNVLNSIKFSNQSFCYIDGGTKKHLDGHEGHMVLRAKNMKRPTVVDKDATPLVAADGKPYAGCYVLAKVGIWAQQNSNGKGMRASLLGVQFMDDGDSFTAGRVASVEEFQDLSVADGGSSATDLM